MKNCHLKKKINLCVGSKSLETSNFVCQNQWYHLNFPKTSVLFLKVFFEVSELFFCVCVCVNFENSLDFDRNQKILFNSTNFNLF